MITLSETDITHDSWKDSSGLYSIPGFIFISKCRQNGEEGGVGIYVAEKLKQKRREDLEGVKLEGIWIEIFQAKANSFIVGAVYRPPETSKSLPRNFNDIFNNNLVTVNNTNKEAILLGDINANFLDRNSCKDLKQLIEANGFKQLIRDPARISHTSSTLIDVILVNNEKNIAKSLVMSLRLSDRDLVACVRKVNHLRFQHRTIRCRNYSKYNPESLKSDFKNFDMSTFIQNR